MKLEVTKEWFESRAHLEEGQSIQAGLPPAAGSTAVETFRLERAVPCADIDGKPIREGSVLVHVKDGDRGVVTEIGRQGHRALHAFGVGDIVINTSPGCYRCTNCYSEWRHVPHNEQTYSERFNAWKLIPYQHDPDRGISRDEGVAIDGIMALLPDDVVDWERGPWPDRLEDALRFLVEHLSNDQTEP